MKKKTFAIIIASIAIAVASAAASATELYISSDSTDKYNKYENIINEYFSEIDEYRELSEFTISGDYDFSDDGIVFTSDKAENSVMVNKELGSDYIFNACFTRDNNSSARILWSYRDEKNFSYLEFDELLQNGNVKLVSVTEGQEDVLANATVDNINGKLTEVRFEVSSGKVTVYFTVENKVTELFSDIITDITGGKTGVEFSSTTGSVKLIEIWQEREVSYDNVIEGYIVSYENLGECTFISAFYNEGVLDSVYSSRVNVTDCGNNYFSMKVNNSHSLQGLERKFFLFDSFVTLIPITDITKNSSYREGSFSDELEPYYQHPTAYSRSTTEMIKRIRGGKLPGTEISDESLTADELPGGERYEIVDMYKKAGIDLSLSLESYVYPDSLVLNIPQKFSRLTPKSLIGNYDQPYSVDAPWNNKIPVDHPEMLLGSWNDIDMTVQMGTVKNKMNLDGNGIGIPYIVGEGDDPEYSLMCKYNTNTTGLHAHVIKTPANLIDYTNYQTTSDNHAIFINGDTKTSIQSMGIRPPGYAGEYNIQNGLLLNYDARATAVSREIDLTGIVTEGNTGTNAASLPMEAFTIKKSELAKGGEINHAMGAAIGNMMKARAYPALSYDYWVRNATNTTNLTGNVPYGGVVRLSKDLPLEKMYADGKLSSPGYKFLKAWRDYGIYNIDCSGNTHSKVVLYTSTENSDWDYAVPYNGSNGITAIEKEIAAFLAGDEYFGMDEKPLMYITIPVAKYTELDVTLDGIVDQNDTDAVLSHIGMSAELTNQRYDINKDGFIDNKDFQVLVSYQTGDYYHSAGDYSITSTSTAGGTIWIDEPNPKDGQWVNVTASPNNGYRFVKWEGEFEDITKNTLHFKADRNYNFKAVFEVMPKCSFDFNIVGEGEVKTSSTMASYSGTVKSSYNANTLLSFKATAADGWVFSHWEGDINSFIDTITVAIKDDMKLTAVFKQPDFADDFVNSELGENWGHFSSNIDPAGADFSLSGSMLKFTDWDEKYMGVVNNSVVLNEGEGFELITYGRITQTGGGNEGMMIFGFKPETNFTFYSFEFNKNNTFRLQKQTQGSVKKLLTFEMPEVVNAYSMMTFRIKYSPEKGISIYMYQGENQYTLVEDYNPGEVISGQFGLGSRHCGAVGFDKFILYKESGSN